MSEQDKESGAAVRGEPVAEPAGWLFGNSFYERSNPRATYQVKTHGRALYDAPVSAHAADALDSQPTARPTDDALWDATLRDRDTYHEWADKLADAIAAHFGVDIGEHSNQNLPWAEALEAIEAASSQPAETAAASVSGWISVADRVPEDDCHVLVASGRYITGKQRITSGHYSHGQRCFFERDVTHWMPLPPAPASSQPTDGEVRNG